LLLLLLFEGSKIMEFSCTKCNKWSFLHFMHPYSSIFIVHVHDSVMQRLYFGLSMLVILLGGIKIRKTNYLFILKDVCAIKFPVLRLDPQHDVSIKFSILHNNIWLSKDHTLVFINAYFLNNMDAYKFGLNSYVFN
jgi:hypothetical protein